jgi:hypothetical protein
MSKRSIGRALGTAILCGGLLASGSAAAALIKLDFSGSGNDCSGDLGTSPTCSFNGSPQILKYDTEGTNKLSINPLFATIDGTEFEFSNNGGTSWVGLASLTNSGWGSGMWRYTPGTNDPAAPVRYWSAKSGPGYNVFFQVADAELVSGGACFTSTSATSCLNAALNVTSGSWTAPQSSLSHILFLDTGGGGGPPGGGSVPEPATLGLIGLGMLAIGALRRRRGASAG